MHADIVEAKLRRVEVSASTTVQTDVPEWLMHSCGLNNSDVSLVFDHGRESGMVRQTHVVTDHTISLFFQAS